MVDAGFSGPLPNWLAHSINNYASDSASTSLVNQFLYFCFLPVKENSCAAIKFTGQLFTKIYATYSKIPKIFATFVLGCSEVISEKKY
jgi:hypothetical protein